MVSFPSGWSDMTALISSNTQSQSPVRRASSDMFPSVVISIVRRPSCRARSMHFALELDGQARIIQGDFE